MHKYFITSLKQKQKYTASNKKIPIEPLECEPGEESAAAPRRPAYSNFDSLYDPCNGALN